MVIEFEIEELSTQILTMGRLKSGCSCWSASWFNG